MNNISESPQDVMFEWPISSDPKIEKQYELDRVMAGQQGLHVIHYAIKPDIAPAQRSKWVDILKAASLANAKDMFK